MIGEELKNKRDLLASELGRARQTLSRNPENPTYQRHESDAVIAYQSVEIKLLQHAVRLLEGALRRRRGCQHCNKSNGVQT